jgi:mannose-6-phosphate isomerase class I
MSADTVRPANGAERAAVLCRDENTVEFHAKGLEGGQYKVTPPFEAASVARIDLNGRYGRARATGARIYYVLGGHGTFEVDGTALELGDGDAVHIRAGQTYDFQGELTLLAVAIPASDLREESRTE